MMSLLARATLVIPLALLLVCFMACDEGSSPIVAEPIVIPDPPDAPQRADAALDSGPIWRTPPRC